MRKANWFNIRECSEVERDSGTMRTCNLVINALGGEKGMSISSE